MAKDVLKVRTSITIDPNLLAKVKDETDSNVSQFIEEAVRFYIERKTADKESA